MKISRGFTLIEIIIAITLIAFFVTLPILAYSSYLKKTRDAQRKKLN
jgi:prepilin-type N-terminal cleavage/methylation domain-containing protein